MLTIICQECHKEFKISGADFDEHRGDGFPILCPVCTGKKEKSVKIVPVKTKKIK
jgi:hypothetical protein